MGEIIAGVLKTFFSESAMADNERTPLLGSPPLPRRSAREAEDLVRTKNMQLFWVPALLNSLFIVSTKRRFKSNPFFAATNRNAESYEWRWLVFYTFYPCHRCHHYCCTPLSSPGSKPTKVSILSKKMFQVERDTILKHNCSSKHHRWYERKQGLADEELD